MINELKKEHSIIIDALNEIRKLGSYSREVYNKILSIQEGLLAHLNKEDEKLYPLLRNAVKSNRKLQEKINVFVENIGAVSNAAFDFFGNYPTKIRGQLAKETEWLIETLTWRILYEKDRSIHSPREI